MSKKISELDEATAFNDDDIMIINQNGETKQIAKSDAFGEETNEISFTCTSNILTSHNLKFYKLAKNTYFVNGQINKGSGTNNISAGTTTTIGTFNKALVSTSTLATGSSNNTLDGHIAIWTSGSMNLQIPSSGREFSGSYLIVSGIIRTSD